MDWLFDNVAKLVPLALFAYYIISAMRGRREEEQEPQDPAAAERARKIQEEIRRKILERQQELDPNAPQRPVEQPGYLTFEEEVIEEPASLREAEPVRSEPPPPPPVASPREEPVPAAAANPFAEQERQIAEQLAKAEALKEKAQKNLPVGPERSWEIVSKSEIRSDIRQALSSPASLRTSFVVKEILEKPVGLR